LDKQAEVVKDGRVYIFSIDENGYLSKIKIVVPVENPEKFYSVITENPHEGVKLHIEARRDKKLYDSVINEFHELESLLALYFNLKSIKWISPRYDLIPETDEEREKIELFGMHAVKGYEDVPVRTTEESLRNAVESKSRYSPLILPMSFYREGKNDLHNYKHINAFFNFYFVIEGLYSRGKRGETKLTMILRNSTEFTGFVDWILKEAKKNKPKYYRKIQDMLKHAGKSLTIEELIWLIVKVRGDLHHFVNNPKRLRQGTPFNHSEYEAVTFVVHGLAIKAILQRMVEIDARLVAAMGLE
jgi:hypothetical protein